MEYLYKFIKSKKYKNVYLFDNPVNNLLTLNLSASDKKIKPYYITTKTFENNIKKALPKYRLIPIVLSIDMESNSEEGGKDSHANMIIIDTKS